MTLVRQRARIARVRKLQHEAAASAVAHTNTQIRNLEHNRDRLGAMRDVLGVDQGPTLGATLASRGELAMRLDEARDGLAPTIVNARRTLELREAARLGARRQLESAQKLQMKAARAAAEEEERRAAGAHRPRKRTSVGETT